MEPEPFHPLGPESGRDHSGCVRRNLAICQNFLWETEPRVGRPGDPPWSPWKGSENPDSAAQLLAMLTQPPPGLGVQHRAGHSRCLTMPGVATEALHKELLCRVCLLPGAWGELRGAPDSGRPSLGPMRASGCSEDPCCLPQLPPGDRSSVVKGLRASGGCRLEREGLQGKQPGSSQTDGSHYPWPLGPA